MMFEGSLPLLAVATLATLANGIGRGRRTACKSGKCKLDASAMDAKFLAQAQELALRHHSLPGSLLSSMVGANGSKLSFAPAVKHAMSSIVNIVVGTIVYDSGADYFHSMVPSKATNWEGTGFVLRNENTDGKRDIILATCAHMVTYADEPDMPQIEIGGIGDAAAGGKSFRSRRGFLQTSDVAQAKGTQIPLQALMGAQPKVNMTILVRTYQGNIYNAELVAVHSEVDIALIRVKDLVHKDIERGPGQLGLQHDDAEAAEEFKPIEIAPAPETGDAVLAIGNNMGLPDTVTLGIVSYIRRDSENKFADTHSAEVDTIQFDAAANPGNSGGPLLNTMGQCIGIVASGLKMENTAGVSFAVPVKYATDLMNKKNGETIEAGAGGSPMQEIIANAIQAAQEHPGIQVTDPKAVAGTAPVQFQS